MKPKVSLVKTEPLTATVEKCDTCRFYRLPKAIPGSGIVRSGACRRFPELIQKETNDWCGEWQHDPQRHAPAA